MDAIPLGCLVADRGAGEPISLGASLLAGKKVGPDVLGLLADDHRTVLGWFDWYAAERRAAIKSMVLQNTLKALKAHMAMEEEIFYPAAAESIRERNLIAHAVQEHQQARTIMAKLLEQTKPAARDVDELRTAIEKHVSEEENELFPKVRGSSLDRYGIGSLCAAKRVELLFQLNGGPADLKETPPMPISTDEALGFFVLGLRNIHGTGQQARAMIENMLQRLENYPAVQAKLQQHLAEKRAQLERVEEILEALGEQPSALKDATGAVTGNTSTMMAAMADDEILKGSFGAYGLTNFEIAAYETLLVMAQAAERPDAMPFLQQCLSEERAMAAFLAENMRPTAMRFMQLRSEGAQAGR